MPTLDPSMRESLPEDIRLALDNGTAIIPSHLSSDQFENYLAARDDYVVREKMVRVGLNGSSRLLLVAVETTEEERKRLNFPLFKRRKRISDYI